MVGKDMEKLQSLVDKLEVVYNEEQAKKNKANTITPTEPTENKEDKKESI